MAKRIRQYGAEMFPEQGIGFHVSQAGCGADLHRISGIGDAIQAQAGEVNARMIAPGAHAHPEQAAQNYVFFILVEQLVCLFQAPDSTEFF